MAAQFKIGILGTASIADRIVEGASQSEHVKIMAVAGRNPARTAKWAAKRDIRHAFDSYETLIKSGTVDAVYIPLPNSLHVEWTLKALEAGLAVLCEKPTCTRAGDAEKIRAASLRTGLPVVEAFMYIHHPMYIELLRQIQAGCIGDVKTIDSHFSWMCDEHDAGSASAQLQGGALLDVGCYCVHLSRKIAGCEPVAVSAFWRRGFKGRAFQEMGFDARNDVDDTMIGMLDFPNGVLAHFETSISEFERHGVEITGTKGVISIERPWVQDNQPCGFTITDGDGSTVVEFDAADTYQLELESFARIAAACAANGRTNAASLDDLQNNAAVITVLFESAASGKAVVIASQGPD